MNKSSTCPPSSGCCTPNRRDFLRFTGFGAAAMFSPRVFAGPFEADANFGLGLGAEYPVPLDKKLSADWLASLTARGKSSSWTDWTALQHIGMPVAGIGTGTVYLGGDGRLWGWDIFNVPHEGCVPNKILPRYQYSERDGANYVKPPKMESPWNITQGLVVHVGGKALRLDHSDFPQVKFTGEYPVGRVDLSAPDQPLSATIEAWSPFIPLAYDDSSLPLTVLEVTLKNNGDTPLEVELEAFLENAALQRPSAAMVGCSRITQVGTIAGGAMVSGSVTVPEAAQRPDILIADFEADSWEKTGWTAAGEAFAGGPFPRDKEPGYHNVSGHQGTRYANSHNARVAAGPDQGDRLVGTLLSPPFKAERKYINFLVVGGNHPGQTCLEILLGDKVLASATGNDSNSFSTGTIDISKWQGEELRLRLADRVDKPGWGHIGVDHIVLSDAPAVMPKSMRNWGSLAVAMLAPGAKGQAARGQDSTRSEKAVNEVQEMAVRASFTLPPKSEVKVPVLIAWHFPHVHPVLGDQRRWYAGKFTDAGAVAAYAGGKFEELSHLTRLFRETWYGTEEGESRGTLPHWLLERALWTISTITTGGTYRLTGNRIWGWEGTGCCEGTCTHVWHYGQSMGRLFPQSEIDLRERTDFVPESGMRGDGMIRFRGAYSGANHPCIDGQVGIILRCYREHLSDPSGEFLKRNWPNIKNATDFLVRAEADGKPGGNDGIFNKRFENTLDAKWGGEIPWLVGLYLAGLRGAAAMAEAVGEPETAKQWEAIVAKGKAAYDAYFDPKLGYHKAKFTEADLEPVHISIGCHIDMCLGDFWLTQVGLPTLGRTEDLRRSMHSLYLYNFMPDNGVYRDFCKKKKLGEPRWYAMAGEAGLLMTTWPHGGLPPQAISHPERFGYFQECMSGFEHAAAALMVSMATDETDPLLLEGLAVCRAVHDRFDASRRNPYNEIECSDHYARAMASYGVFIAACGFHGDAARGLLRFDPKIGAKDFAGPFIGPGAWGRFSQKHAATGLSATLAVRFGSTRLACLELTSPATRAATTSVTLAGNPLDHRIETRDGRMAVILAQPVILTTGQTLNISA